MIPYFRCFPEAQAAGTSKDVPRLFQHGDHGSHLPGMELGGLELVAELRKIALSLASSTASRSSSFLSR